MKKSVNRVMGQLGFTLIELLVVVSTCSALIASSGDPEGSLA